MKHFFIFRYAWNADVKKDEWPFYSFLAKLDKETNTLMVPMMEEKEDGTVDDPMNIRRLVALTELTQIGAQSTPEMPQLLNGERIIVSMYTMDIRKAREEPLLEGGPLEIVFEDEIVNQGHMFGTPFEETWKDILIMPIPDKKDEEIRGHRDHPAPLIRYHGTSKKYASSIIRTGLRPTTKLGMIGNNIQYFGHFVKALRYSYADSQRMGEIRDDPYLLRYAIFVKPEEVIRATETRSIYGAFKTRSMTKDDYMYILDKNKDYMMLDCDDRYKDAVSYLYGRKDVGMYHVLDIKEPFATLEDARASLMIGDQEIRTNENTYFTGHSPVMGGRPIDISEKVTIKAYEVDSFWVPVVDERMGIRYYSFTKYPEIGVRPDVTSIKFIGAFEPEPELPKLKADRDPLRHPFALVGQLVSGKRFFMKKDLMEYLDC